MVWLERVFRVLFNGVGWLLPKDRVDNSLSKTFFRFSDEEGLTPIEEESLTVISNEDIEQDALRPVARVAKFWNALILGK